MSVEQQQGRAYQLDLFDEALLKDLRLKASKAGGTGTGVLGERQTLAASAEPRALVHESRIASQRKPPWYVIRMHGGVGGGDREESPYPIYWVSKGPRPLVGSRGKAHRIRWEQRIRSGNFPTDP